MAAIKKYVLLVGILLSTTVARAQGQLSIKISPSIAFNRVHTSPDNAGFASVGSSLGFKLGAIYDHLIRDNYYLSTGLSYAGQQMAIQNEGLQTSLQEKHALYYLQIPVLLKLYTSELTLDTRLYAELGFMGQVRVNERNTDLPDGNKPFIEAFRRWGVAGLLGVGVEYDTSLSTSLFVGISYQRGLSSVIDKQRQDLYASEVMGYSDLVSLDLGVRF